VKVLVLAGTSEAREVAELLSGRDATEAIVSLAGHTSQPASMPCPVRTGGFGGVEGLVAYLRAANIDVLVDATHPFSAIMPANAAKAAAVVGIPTVRLLRPPWLRQPGDEWIDASDLHDAARRVAALGARRVMLTIGRLELTPFASLTNVHFVVRSIDEPDRTTLPGATVIRERGPFDADAELALLREHAVDCLVAKNSGGGGGKLDAARRAGLRVVMVQRPPSGGGSHVATAHDAIEWLFSQ
jgi:precorrin-6A/cobalt-precorrin-6A reductase